ncbi:MAG: zinc-dependent metalloprotease [Bacteroidetes bacterium]|nr:zinc-dependent metalloprotease [Bacteroidota bacterium]
MMKVRFLPASTPLLALLIACILPSADLLAQTRLFNFPSEEEKVLSAEQMEKYRTFEQQSTSAHIELVRIGDLLPSLHRRMLTINLPNFPVEYIAESAEVMYHSPDDYIWHGDLPAVHGHMILVNSNGGFTGVIEFGPHSYKIEPLGGDLHALITMEMMANAPIDDLMPIEESPNDLNKSSQAPVHKTNTANKNIEVLVLYTDNADNAVGNIASTASNAISGLSSIYSNSGITSSELTVSLAGVDRLNFTESGNIERDRDNLVINTQANNLRERFWADAVILFTDGNYDAYGIAKQIEANSSSAFAIVEAYVATSRFTFAHELAHLQGARHQQCSHIDFGSGCSRDSGSAHGYSWVTTSGQYELTIMHQTARPSYVNRIPYFSNPDVTYNGNPTGTPTNNVAQKLRDTASRIANFRDGNRLSTIILGGTTASCAGDPLTFLANSYGGNGSFSYQWETSYNGISYSATGSASSYATTMPPDLDLYIKLTVTSGVQQKTDFEYVENLGDSPYCGLHKARKEREILTHEDRVPTAFTLNEAYPNPFNPATSITFGLPESGDATLIVYDIWGRQVSELVNGFRSAGYHNVLFDASHLPSGVYLYRLQSGSFVVSKKITLLK